MVQRSTDLSGQRFGRLTAMQRVGLDPRGKTLWQCICECGNRPITRADRLVSGQAASCGCLCRERGIAANTTHGRTGTQAYRTWQNMRNRCGNPRNTFWRYYGGRGITVCEQWRTSFEQFYADMGDPPPGMTLDRINVDGNYEPGNCRWASRKEQLRNTRRNHILTVGGQSFAVSEWAERLSILPSTLYNRLYDGWSVERALTTPIAQQQKAGAATEL
jgi:hypothetical protein